MIHTPDEKREDHPKQEPYQRVIVQSTIQEESFTLKADVFNLLERRYATQSGEAADYLSKREVQDALVRYAKMVIPVFYHAELSASDEEEGVFYPIVKGREGKRIEKTWKQLEEALLAAWSTPGRFEIHAEGRIEDGMSIITLEGILTYEYPTVTLTFTFPLTNPDYIRQHPEGCCQITLEDDQTLISRNAEWEIQFTYRMRDYELVGSGEDGILTLTGDLPQEAFERLEKRLAYYTRLLKEPRLEA